MGPAPWLLRGLCGSITNPTKLPRNYQATLVVASLYSATRCAVEFLTQYIYNSSVEKTTKGDTTVLAAAAAAAAYFEEWISDGWLHDVWTEKKIPTYRRAS